ncbi:MAG: MBL fold metallo-hydrolase [Anaerolineales bacterium]
MQKIAKDIYIESSFAGVTVGAVVTPEGIICIDTPTQPTDARRWRLRLAQLSQKPIQFVINLDHHRDRVLGNQWFDAPVIAHEVTSERVRQMPELFKGGLSEAGADADLATDLIGMRFVAPQLTFADRMTLIKGGRTINLVHRPGPAPGAIWVEFPDEQIVFTGDAVTNDVPPLMHEAQLDEWLDNLALLQKKKFPAQVVAPGRGAPTDKQGVKDMEDFLKAARRKVESLLRARKLRADVASASDLLDYFTVPATLRDHYTRRLRAGLEHLYDVLSAGR